MHSIGRHEILENYCENESVTEKYVQRCREGLQGNRHGRNLTKAREIKCPCMSEDRECKRRSGKKTERESGREEF